MIRPSYALKLARTKLRSKRGVLIASIIVASLLFAALIAMVIVFTGAEKSAISRPPLPIASDYWLRSNLCS